MIKKMRRKVEKIISVLLLVTLIMTGLPMGNFQFVLMKVYAEETAPTGGTCGENLHWELSNDGTLTISGMGDMYDWSYSENDASPWYKNDNIINVVIEEGVTSIGSHAFYYCKGLTKIILPDSGIERIKSFAFAGCDSLKDVTIPNSVTSIQTYAFFSCDSLTEIIIPSGITRIAEHTFSSCDNLTTVELPEDLTIIGTHAFSYCHNLKNIILPDSVTWISDYAFRACKNLTKLTIPSAVTNIEKHAFDGCGGLTEIIIPESVKNIGDYAFSGCSGVTELIIPESVQMIGEYAFSSCLNVKKITIRAKVPWIGDHVFANCSSLENVAISNTGRTIFGTYAFFNCSSLTEITVLGGVDTIGSYAFAECSSLTEITFLAGVRSIGEGAFSNCDSLKEVKIPDSVTRLSDWVFSGCDSLTEIAFSDSVTSIGENAFSNCDSLEKIIIPDSVTTIGAWAFASCPNLAEIIIPDSVTNIEKYAFSACGLDHVYYSGSKEEWEVIQIAEYNEGLDRAIIHYNSTGPVEGGISGTLQCSSVFSIETGKTGSIVVKAFENNLDSLTELVDSVTWTSADESIVAVEGGKLICGNFPIIYETEEGIVYKVWDAIGRIRIRGVSAGSTTITGTTSDGTAVSCKVTVAEPVDEEGGGSGSGGSLSLGENVSGSANNGDLVKFFPKNWSLNNTVFPIEITVIDKGDCYEVRGSVGVGRTDWLDDNTTWDKYKQNVSNANKYMGRISCLEQFRKTWDVKSLSVVSTDNFSILPKLSVMGYFENTYDKNWNLISETGKLAADAKWEGSISWQFVTPIGPLYLNLSGSGKLTGNLETEYNYDKKIMEATDGSLKLTPSVALEGGYGIDKVATIGAEGRLSLPISLIPATKGDLEAKAALHVNLVFVIDYKHDLAAFTQPLWDTTDDTIKTKSIRARKGTVFSIGTLSEIDTSSLNDVSAWNTRNSQDLTAQARNVADDTEITLLEGILGSSLPMQAEVGGKRVMVFQSYDKQRSKLNSSVLMYSVYEDNAWSNPQAVGDTGTADLYADMKVVDGKLVLVWQKEKTEITGDVTNDSENVLKQMAGNSEICFAIFDEENNTFSEPVYVTDNSIYDMMPRICDNSDEIVISWVRNDASALLQETGTNTIYTAKWDDSIGAFGKETELAEASGTVDDYVMYKNGDTYETIFAGQTDGMTAMFDSDGHVIEELSDLFMFSEDGSISGIQYVDGKIICVSNGTLYSYNPSDKTVETYLAGESAFGAEIQYASNENKSGYVWSLYDEETGKGSIVVAMETEDGYSEPVTLYEKEGTIWRYVSPTINENGNWQFITNAENAGDGSHSLVSIVKAPDTGVSLAGASVDENDKVNGETGVDYFLTNTGDTPITELELTVTLEDGKNITKKVPVNIFPGEDAVGTAYVDLSDVDVQQNVQISIYEEGQTDKSECMVKDTIGQPDVSVTGSYIEDGENVRVTAVVANESAIDAEVLLTLFGDETQKKELEKKDNITLKAKESQDISFMVSKNEIIYNENDAAYLTLKAESVGGDYEKDNNIAYVVLYKEKIPETDTGDSTSSNGAESETPTTGITTPSQPSGNGNNPAAQTVPEQNNGNNSLPPAGTMLTDNRTNAVYMVTEQGVSVAYTQNLNTKATTVTIPSKVTIGNVTYKVISIAKNAFKNNKKLKKVIIAGSVTSIGKKAFYNCKNLRSMIVKTKKLTRRSVENKAFTKAGSNDYHKFKVKVPTKKYRVYSKIFKKKGLSSKVKIIR